MTGSVTHEMIKAAMIKAIEIACSSSPLSWWLCKKLGEPSTRHPGGAWSNAQKLMNHRRLRLMVPATVI